MPSEQFVQPKSEQFVQPPNPPYPELHVRPLAEPLLTGLGGGEDRHLLPIQLQNTRVLVSHHLQEDTSHQGISPLLLPGCSAFPEPVVRKGNACREVPGLLLGVWLVSLQVSQDKWPFLHWHSLWPALTQSWLGRRFFGLS